MNSHQIARANSQWMERPPSEIVAKVTLYAALLCLLLIFGLICTG